MSYTLKSILETPISEFIGDYSNPPIDLLLPQNEVVEYYMNNPPFYDEPKVYGFASLLHKSVSVKKYHRLIAPEIFIGFAGGASLDKNRALWKVIGESVERYALFMNGRKGIKGSFYKLSKNKNLLDPQLIFSSKNKIQTSDKRKAVIEWIEGKDLTNQKNCLIPTQLIAVPYWDCGNETIWRAPITTGAAAGSSLKSAIFNGICEVIERDAFMVSWLKQLQLKKIVEYKKVIEQSNDKYSLLFIKTLQAVYRYNLTPEFYILPNDTTIHTVMCILRDQTNIAPPLTIGLDADLSIVKTMLGALEECLQLRPWIRQLYETKKTDLSDDKNLFNIENLEQRANLWTNNKSVKLMNNWLKPSKTIQLKRLLNKKGDNKLGDLINSINKQNATVYFTDLTRYTPKSVHEKKLFSVKVIIPEYQPLYLIERFADHVWKRLSSAEERLESRCLISKNSLQKYPHPML